MSVKLVITEKPSVAHTIASVLGADTRKDGYLEGGGCIVSWCVGHLAELANAEEYNPQFAKWRIEDLPILPDNWRYAVPHNKQKRFAVLRSLMDREDVTEIVNACDAGREGELIFRNVYILAGCKKPMLRLWVSSMEDAAIREGFAHLRDGHDYDGLYQAALCRSKADWLVGINATRLYSVMYHRTLNVGRVMSPTLALLTQREAEIASFTPEPFWTVELACGGMTASGEQKILRLAALGLLRAVSGPYRYEETAATLENGGESFTVKGRTVLDMGWRVFTDDAPENTELPPLTEGQRIAVDGVTVKEGQTTPPKHFTEDTLLSAMETAGAKDAPEDAAFGVPAQAQRSGLRGERRGNGTERMSAGRRTKRSAVCPDAAWGPPRHGRLFWKSWSPPAL